MYGYGLFTAGGIIASCMGLIVGLAIVVASVLVWPPAALIVVLAWMALRAYWRELQRRYEYVPMPVPDDRPTSLDD